MQTVGSTDTRPVHLFHHAFRQGGGMERYALVLSANLEELGYRVVFHARAYDSSLAERMQVLLEPLPVARFPRKLQDFRFFRRIDRLRPGLEGIQIALTRVRARDAVMCGGTHRGYLAQAGKFAGPFDRLQIWMEIQAYRAARTIISHSELCTRDLITRYGVDPSKICTLFPPVDSRFTPPANDLQRAEDRRKLGLPLDKVVLLFPSMGHSRKGLKPICRALAGSSEPFVLAVAGKPLGAERWPFVHYLGFLEDMVAAYRAADFTILGSHYEPFGLVGPESLMCGTRLVFEARIGCLAAIKPELVFTFSVADPESIRRSVSQAIALARSGRHRVDRPLEALRYNPSPPEHAAAVLHAAAG